MLWYSSVQLTNIQMLRYNRELGYDAITPKQETEIIDTLTCNQGSHEKLQWSGSPEEIFPHCWSALK